MQAFALQKLHNEVDVRMRIDRFNQFADVLVVKARLNPDFANRLFTPLQVH
jgi:hypothetical protein